MPSRGGHTETAGGHALRHAPADRTARELRRAGEDRGGDTRPWNPALKDPDTYTIRRTAKPRFDIPPKVNGDARYGIDFTSPGMLHAAVDIAPVPGGRLVSIDPAPAKAMPGVKAVVELEPAVAVVADSYWRARKALAALEPV